MRNFNKKLYFNPGLFGDQDTKVREDGGDAGHNTANNGNAARANVPDFNVDNGDRVVGNHDYLGAREF